MGTTKLHLDPDSAIYRTATAFPAIYRVDGTTKPVSGLAFDASTEETAYYQFRATNYGSGNWTILVGWYAFSAITNGIAIGVSLAAQTANTDTGSAEAKAFATEVIFTDTHLGTTAMRPHDAVGTISGASLDSVAADDWVTLRFARKTLDGGDTMTGDMILTSVDISYSDI